MKHNDLSSLGKRFRRKAESVLAMADAMDFGLMICCTVRTFEQQARLYRQGRRIDVIHQKAHQLCEDYHRPDLATILMDVGPQYGPIVTNAAPGESLHNYGMAFDAVPMVHGKPVWNADETSITHWNTYGELVRSAGLEWGGDWRTFKDYPHAQMPGVKWQDLIKGTV